MAGACVACSIPLLTLFLCLCAPAPARAGAIRWSGSGELLGGGGYDSNLFLQIAASPDSPNFHAYRGGFLRVNPTVAGAATGEGYRFQLRYGADLLQTFGAGRLFIQDGDLSLSLPELGPVGLRLAATAGRFDAGQFASDRFWSWGGRGQVTVRLRDHLHGSALYEREQRRFGDPGVILIRSDVGQLVRLRIDGTPTAVLALGIEAEYLALRSELVDPMQAEGRLRRVRGGGSASYTPRPTVTLAASFWAGAQSTDGGGADRQGGGDATIALRASAVLDLVGHYELLVNRNQTGGTNYARQVLTVALVGHVTVPPRRVVLAAAMEIAADQESRQAARKAGGQAPQQAPQIAGTRVQFRVRAPDARTVAVIGSWNGWLTDQPQQRLRRTSDPALWQGWVEVGAGQHRYHFLVDDRPLRPVDAPRYRADDFGGEDGVIEVGDDDATHPDRP